VTPSRPDPAAPALEALNAAGGAGPGAGFGPEARGVLRRALYAALALPTLLLAGGLGYVVVEGWSLGDGVYMTLMTITTVGYRELYPLSQAGRWLTGGIIVAGVTWLAVWFATVTSFFIEIDVFHIFRGRRMEREIGRLENHVIVCGVGRTGTQVIAELLRSGVRYVALDADPARVAALRAEAPHLRLVEGDTTRDEVLVRAGIGKARGLVTALSQDTDNLFVTITARALNPDLTIVARANDDDSAAKLYRAGANHVVSPQRIGGVRMASLLLRPGVMSLLDVMTRGGGVTLSIEEIPVAPGSDLAGRTLGEAGIARRTGALVVAIRRSEGGADKPFLFNPQAGDRVEEGETLIAMGEEKQIDALRDLAGTRARA
jgi:voltage-gated potassium channel